LADVDVLKEQFTKALNWAVSYASIYRHHFMNAIVGVVRNQLESNLADLTGLRALCSVDATKMNIGDIFLTKTSPHLMDEYYSLRVACRAGSYFITVYALTKATYKYDPGSGRGYYDQVKVISLEDLAVEKWTGRHYMWLSRKPARAVRRRPVEA